MYIIIAESSNDTNGCGLVQLSSQRFTDPPIKPEQRKHSEGIACNSKERRDDIEDFWRCLEIVGELGKAETIVHIPRPEGQVNLSNFSRGTELKGTQASLTNRSCRIS